MSEMKAPRLENLQIYPGYELYQKAWSLFKFESVEVNIDYVSKATLT